MVNLENLSFIEDSNGKKAVILSIEAYNKMKEQLEELEDIHAYSNVKSEGQSSLPISIIERLVQGEESKIKILREYRSYNLTNLAKDVGISEAYLSQIENQKRKGTIKLYKTMAEVLDVDVELLIDQ